MFSCSKAVKQSNLHVFPWPFLYHNFFLQRIKTFCALRSTIYFKSVYCSTESWDFFYPTNRRIESAGLRVKRLTLLVIHFISSCLLRAIGGLRWRNRKSQPNKPSMKVTIGQSWEGRVRSIGPQKGATPFFPAKAAAWHLIHIQPWQDLLRQPLHIRAEAYLSWRKICKTQTEKTMDSSK